MRIPAMRHLRHKHNISVREVARAAGVTPQFISNLELGKYVGRYNYRKKGEALIQIAFESIISSRLEHIWQLSDDFLKHRHNLLGIVESDLEDTDEL